MQALPFSPAQSLLSLGGFVTVLGGCNPPLALPRMVSAVRGFLFADHLINHGINYLVRSDNGYFAGLLDQPAPSFTVSKYEDPGNDSGRYFVVETKMSRADFEEYVAALSGLTDTDSIVCPIERPLTVPLTETFHFV